MLKIEILFNRGAFRRAQKLKPKLTYNSLLYNSLACIVAGILLILLNENRSENQNTFAISWSALLVGMLWLFQYIEAIIKYNKYIKATGDRFEHEQMDCEYTFHLEGLSYRDKEKSFSCRWDLLKGYSLSKEFLILHVLGKASCDVIIDRIHIPWDKFEILDSYLTKNLKQVIL